MKDRDDNLCHFPGCKRRVAVVQGDKDGRVFPYMENSPGYSLEECIVWFHAVDVLDRKELWRVAKGLAFGGLREGGHLIKLVDSIRCERRVAHRRNSMERMKDMVRLGYANL